MTRIEPYLLWLGHAGDGRNTKAILDADIQAVVQLALDEPPLQLPRELVYLRFPLVDGSGNSLSTIRLAIENVSSLLRFQIPTLVCCGAGLSRTPVLAAAALAALDPSQGNLEQYLATMAITHPCDVSPPFLEEIKQVIRQRPRC